MARKNEPYIYQVLRRETPNPRQQAFFRAEAANVAYGGARGGGKSWAMRRKLVLLAMRYPGLKLLLLRRTLPELRANHILPLQRELAGYAVWSGAERAFRFPFHVPTGGVLALVIERFAAAKPDLHLHERALAIERQRNERQPLLL